MDENLKIVGDNIMILKSIAQGIGEKISEQIQTIDEINDEVRLLKSRGDSFG